MVYYSGYHAANAKDAAQRTRQQGQEAGADFSGLASSDSTRPPRLSVDFALLALVSLISSACCEWPMGLFVLANSVGRRDVQR